MNVSYIFILLERVGLGFGDERYTVQIHAKYTQSQRVARARKPRPKSTKSKVLQR